MHIKLEGQGVWISMSIYIYSIYVRAMECTYNESPQEEVDRVENLKLHLNLSTALHTFLARRHIEILIDPSIIIRSIDVCS